VTKSWFVSLLSNVCVKEQDLSPVVSDTVHVGLHPCSTLVQRMATTNSCSYIILLTCKGQTCCVLSGSSREKRHFTRNE